MALIGPPEEYTSQIIAIVSRYPRCTYCTVTVRAGIMPSRKGPVQSPSTRLAIGFENEVVKCSAAQLKQSLWRSISGGHSRNLGGTVLRDSVVHESLLLIHPFPLFTSGESGDSERGERVVGERLSACWMKKGTK